MSTPTDAVGRLRSVLGLPAEQEEEPVSPLDRLRRSLGLEPSSPAAAAPPEPSESPESPASSTLPARLRAEHGGLLARRRARQQADRERAARLGTFATEVARDPVGFGKGTVLGAGEAVGEVPAGLAELTAAAARSVPDRSSLREVAGPVLEKVERGAERVADVARVDLPEPQSVAEELGRGTGRLSAEVAMLAVPATKVAKLPRLARAGKAVRGAVKLGGPVATETVAGAGRAPERSMAGVLADALDSETFERISQDPVKRATFEGLSALGMLKAVDVGARSARALARPIAEFTSNKNTAKLATAIAEEVAKAAPDIRKLNALRRSFLLSNLGGRIRDIGSNAVLAAFNTAARVPAAGLDVIATGTARALGSRTAHRTRFVKGSFAAQAQGLAEGARNVAEDLGVAMFLRELRRSDNLADALRRLPEATRRAWERLLELPGEAAKHVAREAARDVEGIGTQGRYFEPHVAGVIETFQSPVGRALVRLPIKLTTVSDRLFAPAAFRESVNNGARYSAAAMGMNRRETEDYVRRVLANVPSDLDAPGAEAMLQRIPENIRLRAWADAKISTYINENHLSRMIEGAAEKAPAVRELLDFLFPFRRAGYNTVARAAEYSPIGLAKGVTVNAGRYLSSLSEQTLPLAQQRLVDQLARGSLGTAALYFGYLNRDLITPHYATVTEKGKRLLRQAGEPYGGLRIPETLGDIQLPRGVSLPETVAGLTLPGTGHTITIEKLGPLGPIVEWGAEIGREEDRQEEQELEAILEDVPPEDRPNRFLAALTSGARIAMEQLPFRATEDVGAAIESPSGLERYLSREAASIAAPQFLSTLAAATDPIQRETRGDGGLRAQTARAIQARIPGASRSLPPRLDVFGEPEQRKSGLGAVVNPLGTRRRRTMTDPLRAELERVGLGIDYFWPREGKARETPEQLHLLGRLGGVEVRAQLEKIIQSDAYQRIPEQLRRELSNADPTTVEQIARIKQREMLENVVSRTRGRERKKLGGVILELTTQPASGR